MAKKVDLMGLGLPVFLSGKIANDVVVATAVSSSIGAAYVIGGEQYLTYVIDSSGANTGVVLPAVGGTGAQAGSLLGDEFKIINESGSVINVYIKTCTSYLVGGVSVSGSLGISVSVGGAIVNYPISASTWVGLRYGSGA